MTSPFYYFYNSITCELLISLSSSDKLLNISIISFVSSLSHTLKESKYLKATSISLFDSFLAFIGKGIAFS